MMNGEWGCHIGLAALARRQGPCEARGGPDGAAAASGQGGRARDVARRLQLALAGAVLVLLAIGLA